MQLQQLCKGKESAECALLTKLLLTKLPGQVASGRRTGRWRRMPWTWLSRRAGSDTQGPAELCTCPSWALLVSLSAASELHHILKPA